MDTMLDTTKIISSVCFSLLSTDVAWDNLFFSCRVIALAFFLTKLCRLPTIIGAISLWFGAMYNALLHASGHYPTDKIEERINFALSHERLYLAEPDDEWENKFDAANIFCISCGGGGSRSSLSAITRPPKIWQNGISCHIWHVQISILVINFFESLYSAWYVHEHMRAHMRDVWTII